MKFKYKAAQTNGALVEGEFDAGSQSEILRYLSLKGLKPIYITEADGAKKITAPFLNQSITIEDQIFLTRYLALMLKIGTDLFRAIDVLIDDFEKPAVKALLIEIRASLEKGQPFHAVFARYPQYFSSVFVNMVKAGEASGNLEMVFEDLSNTLQRSNNLRREIRSMLVYPAILVVMSASILFTLVSFALPKISRVFTESGVEPPIFSRIVFAVGGFIGAHVWLFLLGIVFSVAALWFFFGKTQAGAKFASRAAVKLPLIGSTLKTLALQRFASTLSALLRSGLPILDAMRITADTVGNDDLRKSLYRIADEGIAKGLTIGDAFKREPAFPRVVVNLMAISERAGHIADVLATLASFYETEVQNSIKTLMAFVEPIMLLLIGMVIGTIALSIIVPIYQLTTTF